MGILTETELVRARFARDLQEQRESFRARYWELAPGVINTDTVKELCTEYAADRVTFSKCIYDPAREFAERLFAEEVASGRWQQVTFFAGGAASGKTVAVGAWRKNNSIPDRFLTVDGTLSDYSKAFLQCSLAAKFQLAITILYIFCPLEKAIPWALDRALKHGRVLTLKRLVETHFGAQQTVLRLQKSPPAPDMEFVYMTNSGCQPAIANLESILANCYLSLEDALLRARSAYENELACREREGRPIPERIHRAFSA